METKVATCTFCDGGCALAASEADGALKVVPANPAFPAICSKASLIDEYRLHPDRLTTPLKRVGAKGSGSFEAIIWDCALDEIADRLERIIAESGPEALAVSEMPLNHGFGGLTRRLMNYLGSPNYLTALELCMGNTFQVHRAVYGGATASDWAGTDCIIYFGQHRDSERWPAEYLRLKAAKDRGAALIVVDPRTTETARMADWHLPLRYGTDAALALGWIHVILAEGLYDRDFVEAECVGFEALQERVASYSPEKVADVCGLDAETIRRTARIYAESQAAIIPWGATADMQVNSTALIQAQCILRALGGFLGASEKVLPPAAGVVTAAQVAAFDRLSEEQRAKQLGASAHPLLTSRTSTLYRSTLKRAGISHELDILATSHCAVPSAVFAAMRGEGPYRVRAMLSVANNTLMSYAGQPGIQEALRSLDLLVVYENWLTPTAQLADYVLPGDMWAERDTLGKPFDVAPAVEANVAFREPVAQCRSWFRVVQDLAERLGLVEAFPWTDERAFFDWRLAPAGLTFQQLCAQRAAGVQAYPIEGFLTPSGKVELASSVLADLGCDPLPAFVQRPDPEAEGYPYLIFAGGRERPNYNTALRQMPSLRCRQPEPQFFINPADGRREGIAEGEWCVVESAYGAARLMAHLDDAQPESTLRIPHGWWKPELEPGLETDLSGAGLYNDGLLFPDAEWNLDGPQGVPGLRGSVHGRIRRSDAI